MSKTYLLVDSSNVIYRFFHGMPELTGPDGITTHALIGFVNLLANPFKRMPFLPADHEVICFWDSPGKGGDKAEEQPEWLQYKGNRPKQDQGLYTQMGLAYRASQMMGWGNVKEAGVEADSMLGSFCLTKMREEPGSKLFILSSDKDMAQLIGPQVSMVSMQSNPYTLVGHDEIVKRWGVNPIQIPDMLAMMGDKSDNIPGIPGIGEKAAQECLKTYRNLDDAMVQINRASRIGEKLPRYAKLLLEHADRLPILMSLIKFSEIHSPVTTETPRIKELKALLTSLGCVRAVSNVEAYQTKLRGKVEFRKPEPVA